jgi:hypothetical protein
MGRIPLASLEVRGSTRFSFRHHIREIAHLGEERAPIL